MSTDTTTAESLSSERSGFVRLIAEEKYFLMAMLFGFVAVSFVFPIPWLARWVGFAIAGYSAVANDSVQTLGTFIGSNQDKPWWLLWLFIGGIFLATMGYSWWAYDGDVSYERLAAKGFQTAPETFTYLQVAAPLVLLVLTRAGIPVSTSLLLLSCFAASTDGISSVLFKSWAGYGVAFVCALLVWLFVGGLFDRYMQRKPANMAWRIGQWATTGCLWSVWLMQDAANIAVYLPRSLSVMEFAGFAAVIFFGLGFMFFKGGERVQKVVDEKARVRDVRAATLVDFIYAIVLYVFKVQSNIPMSTTWVFVGLLAGRELGMTLRHVGDRDLKGAFKLAGKDILYVTIGLIVSIVIAYAANAELRDMAP